MLKKLRRRFVGSAMAAITVVMFVLLAAVNITNCIAVTGGQDDILRAIAADGQLPGAPDEPPKAPQSDGSEDAVLPEPPMQEGGRQGLPGSERFSDEVRYMLRFFTVYADAQGVITRIDQDNIASVTEEEAEHAGIAVMLGGRERGYYGTYRYLVTRTEDGGSVMTFLNSEREIENMRMLLRVTALVSGGSLVLVLVLVWLFSSRAVAPYVRNLEAQKRFITDAGHELKTPLTAIATSADVLEMEHGEDEWVANIRAQTARMSGLVGDLVTLSRLDEENPFPERTAFDLGEAVWEIVEPFRALAGVKGRTIRSDIAQNLHVTGDRACVQQMVSILLDNALKYSTEGSTIRLTTARHRHFAEITVENSCTIAPETDLSRFFDRFYRGDPAHSGPGTGIGLSIVRAAAEAHGGYARAVRREGGIAITAALRL